MFKVDSVQLELQVHHDHHSSSDDDDASEILNLFNHDSLAGLSGGSRQAGLRLPEPGVTVTV